MLSETLSAAINGRKLLKFQYDDLDRLVEPHAVGLNKTGSLMLRGYQVTGESATDPRAWKLFTVEKIVNLEVMDFTFAGPRDGYRAGDRAMTTILAELPEPPVLEEAA